MARPPAHLRTMADSGAHADAGRADLRLHELLSQYRKQAASERAGERVHAPRQWREPHLCRPGARSGRRGALDRQQGGGWIRAATAGGDGAAIVSDTEGGSALYSTK